MLIVDPSIPVPATALEEADGADTPPDFFTRNCARLARLCMWVSVAGLVGLLLCVAYQVFGRHVLNNTPTWAESLSLLLVLYVTMLGAAVGVRDAGHIGFEVLVGAMPLAAQRWLQILIHLLVLAFGVMMAWNCALLADSVMAYKTPNLGISDAWKYLPAVISGVLIAIFSVEHIVALIRHQKVVPAWH